jgi:hydrogenase nickel incorporation protein HypA/HybF
MHEVGITEEIIDIALRHAASAKVRRIIVEIGSETAVLPDAVRFCFDLCAEGTPVEGAELEIVELTGDELRVRSVEVV